MIAMPRYRLEASAAEGAGTRLAEVAAEHAAVLAAVESGDAMAAAAAMRTHLGELAAPAGARIRPLTRPVRQRTASGSRRGSAAASALSRGVA